MNASIGFMNFEPKNLHNVALPNNQRNLYQDVKKSSLIFPVGGAMAFMFLGLGLTLARTPVLMGPALTFLQRKPRVFSALLGVAGGV